jgi:hypothetical protein
MHLLKLTQISRQQIKVNPMPQNLPLEAGSHFLNQDLPLYLTL